MLDTRGLLERLCQLTTEVLGCNCSHTLVWDPEDDVYLPVASAGDFPHETALIREARIPRQALASLLSALNRDEVVCVTENSQTELPAAVLYPPKTSMALFMMLRRGGEVCGVQTAAYRERSHPVSEREVRSARAFARLASMALDYAGMVDELDRLNRSKSEFVATMSHELRTPLHVIVGYSDLLQERVLGDLTEEQAESLQHVGERARELLHVITTTLDLTELEQVGLPKEVDVAALVGEVEESFAHVATSGGPRLEWSLADHIPALSTDGAKIKRVVEKLVENAIKFTADDGHVKVDVLHHEGMLKVAVRDTGIGMSPDVVATLFEPFRHVEGEVDAGNGTVGLGLYSVRRLLEMLGGRISVESSIGEGSTFHVSIPANFIGAIPLPERPETEKE